MRYRNDMTCCFSVHAFCARRHAAFSLLELLLTMAILLILTTLYWGPSKASRQRALQASCQKNLEKMYLAMNLYAADQRGHFPAVAGAKTSAEALDLLVPHYTSDTSVFVCPGSGDSLPASAGSLRGRRISYAYYSGRTPTNQEALVTDRQVNTLTKGVGELAFSRDGKPPGNNHHQYGGNVMYCDGHVDLYPAKTSVALPLTPGEFLLNPEP
jgi:prepilin-type N-terminal cleavage/methylation domain-containing protein/prepilin-type processing-associated H-X9-DG protein